MIRLSLTAPAMLLPIHGRVRSIVVFLFARNPGRSCLVMSSLGFVWPWHGTHLVSSTSTASDFATPPIAIPHRIGWHW